MDGQRAETEDRVACPICGEINKGAKRVASSSVMHGAHRSAEMTKPGNLDQVPDSNRRGGEVITYSSGLYASRERGPMEACRLDEAGWDVCRERLSRLKGEVEGADCACCICY